MTRSIGIRYPRGGSNQWIGPSPGAVVLDDAFFGTSDAGHIGVWNGSAWVRKPVKVWTGSAWVIKPLKRWTGSIWSVT